MAEHLSSYNDVRLVLGSSLWPDIGQVYYLQWDNGQNLELLDQHVEVDTYTDADFVHSAYSGLPVLLTSRGSIATVSSDGIFIDFIPPLDTTTSRTWEQSPEEITRTLSFEIDTTWHPGRNFRRTHHWY